jgi:DNA polymerase-4
MPLRVIFLDLNSYFASVEQAENPELIGKPVAVVPMLAETTCCLAASYPAKAYGIKTGTLLRDARKLCPQIIFVKADHRKYVNYHHKIIAAVENCLPVWKVCSIDEMAIKLFGREQNTEFAISKAKEMKKRIAEDVHPALTCSIGIAPNRYIAKIASDMQKPDGLVVIQSEDLPHKLYDLKLRDFPGIGARMEERFIMSGCPSARKLCQQSLSDMHKLWGSKFGEDFWQLIRGEEIEEKENERASIGHSRVLAPDSRTAEKAWAHLVGLLSKAAMRLREEGFYARTLQLHLKFLNKGNSYTETTSTYWEQKARFFETQDTTLLLKELTELWAKAPKLNVLRVGVVLSALVPAVKSQLSLWEDSKQAKLLMALDNLNKIHRKNLVVLGSSIELEKSSHAPIAFGHIPEKYE